MTRQGRVSHTVRASWWALWRQVNPELNPGVDLYLQIQEQARLYFFFFFACSHSDDIHAQSPSACLCKCLCHCSERRLSSSLLRKVWTHPTTTTTTTTTTTPILRAASSNHFESEALADGLIFDQKHGRRTHGRWSMSSVESGSSDIINTHAEGSLSFLGPKAERDKSYPPFCPDDVDSGDHPTVLLVFFYDFLL